MTPELFTQTLGLALEPTDLPAVAHEIVIAHGAFESGWGVSAASRVGRNHWNLTAGSSWKGPVIEAGDHDGQGRPITQLFRRYASHYDAVLGYLAFIGPGTRYDAAWSQLIAGNAAEFVRELRAHGYFTAPLDVYQTGIAGCLSRVRAMRWGRA